MNKDTDMQSLIDEGRKAYYREYRQKAENKAKAKQYRDAFFLKRGLEALHSKGDKISENT